METTISGMHWDDNPWVIQEHHYDLAKPFHWVLQIVHTYNAINDAETHRERQYNHLKRLIADVHEVIVRLPCPAWVNPSLHARSLGPLLREISTFTSRAQIINEPNLPSEGWGSDRSSRMKFNDYFCELLGALRRECPQIQYGFPPLAVMNDDLEWLSANKDAIDRSDFVCSHVYWQDNNWANPDWGLRYIFQLAAHKKDLFLTEYSDSTPAKSNSQKALDCHRWLEEASSYSPRIKAACYFLLDSINPSWENYVLDEESLKILGQPIIGGVNVVTENSKSPDLRPSLPDAFKAWSSANGPDEAVRVAFNAHALATNKIAPTRAILADLTRSTKQQFDELADSLRAYLS